MGSESVEKIKMKSPPFQYICKQCQHSFNTYNSQKIFCSIICNYKFRQLNNNKYKLTQLCKNCKAEFVTHKQNQVHCSKECRLYYKRHKPYNYVNILKICPICNKEYTAPQRRTIACSITCKKEYYNQYHTTYREKDSKVKFHNMKHNAKQRNLPFTLILNDFIKWYNETPDICDYCHIPIKEYTKGIYSNTLSIDRKNNNEGYEPHNIVKACYLCNIMKTCYWSYNEMKEIGKTISVLKQQNKSIPFLMKQIR